MQRNTIVYKGGASFSSFSSFLSSPSHHQVSLSLQISFYLRILPHRQQYCIHSTSTTMKGSELPKLPVAHNELANYIAQRPNTPLVELLEPYRKFEAKLRELYAQDRDNTILDDPFLNVLPLFTEDTPAIQIRARNPDMETQDQKDKYIMSLPYEKRRRNGSPAVVGSLKEFQYNFNIFSESSLSDMDWNNVVAAGSSVVNTLLPVPPEYKTSKRALRKYYHEIFCPASDVDLFLYGLSEEQAIQKIKDIETHIRDAILSEVTVVRTKNAITICSQYPTRHVQIVLRLYKSISEILSGFDIDCSCAAYDGKQVYATPRALASYISQVNQIDLSRRSPSYENRLSKYSHRDFEVYWPQLDRSRVDPTIYERSFQRTLGLARLLVLERLPTSNAREEYSKKRREERGRPDLGYQFHRRLRGNIKDIHEDEVADWVHEDDVSDYHSFTTPYGERFHAKKIEKLFYTKDLLLNAEWNQPKERNVYLHRHPAFFGRVEDVISDCCGTCPKPRTPEEIEVAENEGKIYVTGKMAFLLDDPGRQQIGSFHPLTEDDWTEMAYVGNTARLCQAIVDEDFEHVEDWLSQEGADPNKRDYTGRTPLQLAVISSTPDIVRLLVDHGARLIARIADGRTALHLAAERGNIEIVKILLQKSNSNEEEEATRQDQRRKALKDALKAKNNHVKEESALSDNSGDEDDVEFIDDSSDEGAQSMATGSFVNVRDNDESNKATTIPLDLEDQSDPDFYKLDAVAWDSKCSALHLAILGGHCEVVKLLCQEFGADPLLPVKIGEGSPNLPTSAILTLTLALALPVEKATRMCETLLSVGATSSQADAQGLTAFHRYIQIGKTEAIEALLENDKLGFKRAINHVAVAASRWNSFSHSPLMIAIEKGEPTLVLKLLRAGAKPEIDFDSWIEGAKASPEYTLGAFESNHINFQTGTEQPLILAIQSPQPAIALDLLESGADPSTATKTSYNATRYKHFRGSYVGETALDVVRRLLSSLHSYNGEPVTVTSYNLFGRVSALEEPRGTAEFLSHFPEGTYQAWLVSADIHATMEVYRKSLEKVNKEKERVASLKGLAEKKDAIMDAISQLEIVESALLERGAKTFKQLHPEIETPRPQVEQTATNGVDYTLERSFNVKDLTLARKEGYLELFEAVWSGNLEKIKLLTLAPWGPDAKQPPLKIAVTDLMGNNPFSLACLKGHFSIAKAILEIAQAQWSPAEEQQARFKMTEPSAESDAEYDAGDSDSEPQIYKEVINDQITIENIGQVSMQVKSDVLPSSIISWQAPTFVSHGDKVEQTHNGRQSLFTHAIKQNDSQLFAFLLELATRFASNVPEDARGEFDKFYTTPKAEFEDAIRMGRTNMLAEAIRRVGAGIPLEDLVKESGKEMKVKPRYYQGLTVYGRKRADWATRAGRTFSIKATGTKVPPLLIAALNGSLESVEWFLGDAPERCYREFGKSKMAREEPRLKHLNESPGGFDRAIVTWLGIQNDFVLHCAVLGPLGDNTNRVIEYLTKACPSSLEAKTDLGYTPLYLACLMGRVQFAKTLIHAGADQSVRDRGFNNILHACLENEPKHDQLREMLDLIDPELRTDMFRQRNSLTLGGDTPLHRWLRETNTPSYKSDSSIPGAWWALANESLENVKILSLLLEYSRGGELEILNGSGDTVLHLAVLLSLPEQTRVLLEQNPKLLYRENTVGRTPAEIAHDKFINRQPGALCLPDFGHAHRDFARKLIEKDPSSFVSDSEAKPQKPREDVTWDVVQEYLAKTEGKRHLVSLSEANDVARRLGESYSWQRYRVTSTAQPEYGVVNEASTGLRDIDFVTSIYRSRHKSQMWLLEEPEIEEPSSRWHNFAWGHLHRRQLL
ncbi:ankyrin repeat protein [Xylaria intraflava]|nr:ankyrin repeat protein [Xylaria intraflava]